MFIYFCLEIVKKLEFHQPRKSESGDAGRWAELVRRRSARLDELKREFQGWHGAHEQHCILHDVLLTN